MKISPDRQKMLISNAHQICVLYLKPQGNLSYVQAPVIFNFPKKQINNVFWHSDSYHLIIATDSNIEALEIESRANPVNLVSLNNKAASIFYDTDKDTLYFMDFQKGVDEASYENVYKLELNNQNNILNGFMGIGQNVEK
jgi:hypothetical protein